MTDTNENERAAALKAEIATLDKSASTLLVITTDEQAVEAGNLLTVVRNRRKALDDERDSWVRPLNEQVKRFNALFKPGIDACDAILTKIRKALGVFQDAKDRAAKAEQDRLDAEARKRQEEADAKQREADAKRAQGDRVGARAAQAQATAAAADAGAASVASAHAAPTKLSTSTGGTVKAAKVWTFEVTDPAAVPREFLTIDQTKIRDAVRTGAREIPGVRIFQETRIQ